MKKKLLAMLLAASMAMTMVMPASASDIIEEDAGVVEESVETEEEEIGVESAGIAKEEIPQEEYTVTFDPQDGSGFTSLGKEINGTKYILPPEPQREHYKFNGWWPSKEEEKDGAEVTADTDVSLTENITLYAHWIEVYTITFDGNGGTVADDQKTRQCEYDTAYGELPTASRTGYIVGGWYTAAEGGELVTKDTKATATQTVYAHWTKDKYTITFDGNGGTVAEGQETRQCEYDTAYGELSTVFRTGYTLGGWYTVAEGGIQVTKDTKAIATQTIYAHWTANKYKVTFDPVGGTASALRNEVVFGSKYDILASATKSNFTFAGWYTSETGGIKVTEDTTVTVADDHTLYAHWKQDEYTVYFITDEGTVSSDEKTVFVGDAYGSLPTATRAGYTFAGWYTSENGGAKVTADTIVELKSDEILYAHWNAAKYTVKFNANGGSVSTASKAVTYKTAIGALPTPSRSKYIFAGWYTAAAGGSKVTATTKWNYTSGQTLYAHWTKITVTAPAITNNSVQYVTATSAKITWKASNSNAGKNFSYKVYYSTDNKKWSVVKTTSSLNYTKTGLTRGKNYYFKVQAIISNVSSASQSISYTNKPQKIKLNCKRKSGKIALSWSKPDSKIGGFELIGLNVKEKTVYKSSTTRTDVKNFTVSPSVVKNVKKFAFRVYYKVGKKKIYSDWAYCTKK